MDKKILVITVFFTVMLLFSGGAFSAEEEQPLLVYTLDECLDIALKRSPVILSALEEIKRTTGYIYENWAGILSVNADAGVMYSEPAMTNSGLTSRIEPYEQYNMGLSASLPVFTGGRVLSGLSIAYLERGIAREQYRSAVCSTIYDTRTAFYGVLLAEKQLEVWDEEVDVLTRNLETTTKNFMSGLVPKYDVNRIQVELANARTSRIQANNDLIIATDELKDILDLDLDQPIDIQGEFTFEERDKKLDEYLSAAETGSPELTIKRLTERIAAKNVLVAIGGYFPTINAVASYDYSIANEIDVDFNDDRWEFSGGVTITIPITDLAVTAAKHKQAKAQYEQAKIDSASTAKEIKLSIRKAYFDLEESKQIIDLQKSNVDLARENLERSELRYVNGVETLLELLDARLAVTNARLNYINAIYSYEESLSRLNKIIGDEGIQP